MFRTSLSERFALAAARFLLGAAMMASLCVLFWLFLAFPLQPIHRTLFIAITLTCGGLAVIWGDGFVAGLRRLFERVVALCRMAF